MPISPPAQRKLVAATLLAVAIAWGAAPACATPFTITTPSSAAQTLGSASGETGTIAAGSSLTLGGSTVAVTIKGNNATLNNLGTLSQTGTGRAIRDNTGVSGLTINNGSASNSRATIRTADADVIQMNVPAASVVLNNWGTMDSLNASAGGAQAVDFSSMTGANVVNNMAGGLLQAREADAVRPGANGVVNNDGTIRSTTTSGSSSDGIDGQENSGIRIVNGATGLVDGGRHGITAGQVKDAAFTLDVTNNAGGIIRGNNGSGLNIDGFDGKQMVTVRNAGAIIGNGVTGDGDGVDVDGLVDIVNSGTIRSTNAVSAAADGPAYSEGISAGGGRIVNSGVIEGLVAAGNTNAVGRGITLAGNDIAGSGGAREALYGNANIVNQAGGIIRGQSDSAIAVTANTGSAGFTVTIDNNAGAKIIGGGANAAIRGNGDNTTIINAGTIDGGAGGKAIQLGSGVNALFINGGSARVIGDIDGGSGGKNTMTVAAGAGNTFAYNGAIANFASVEIKSGTFALEGDASIGSATALVLAGGTLKVSSLFDGEQTFASLVLAGDSAIDFGNSVLTFAGLGSIADGAHLALNSITSASGTTLRFLGDVSSDAGFLALVRATGLGSDAVRYSFDGRYTNVSVDAAAVPEPASIALFAGGLGLMGALARRRRV
jgi:hypothetical protein